MGVARRTLVYIPIVHTYTDMGKLGDAVQRVTIQQLGIKAWRHKMRAIDTLWAEMEDVVATLQLPYDRVRLYQDGLPVCGREEEIVRELAARGSRNHCLLLSLMEKGATIMGTESPEMLLEELERVKLSIGGRSLSRRKNPQSDARDSDDTLLGRRNQFIAHRINTTLQPGETGILFLGMLHTLAPLLDQDIQVIYPISQPDQFAGKSND
jgi:hypothetical protein